jgi:hypothetical protein
MEVKRQESVTTLHLTRALEQKRRADKRAEIRKAHLLARPTGLITKTTQTS